MECEDFVGEVEAKVINKNIAHVTLRNSNLLVNETEENRYLKEANIGANIIGNLF